MEGVVKREQDLVFRMKGVGVLFTARSIPGPDNLQDEMTYEAVISIWSDTVMLFEGTCDLFVQHWQRNAVGTVFDRMFVAYVADEALSANIYGSAVNILRVGQPIKGLSLWKQYQAKLRYEGRS